jgi:hypothetical protein
MMYYGETVDAPFQKIIAEVRKMSEPAVQAPVPIQAIGAADQPQPYVALVTNGQPTNESETAALGQAGVVTEENGDLHREARGPKVNLPNESEQTTAQEEPESAAQAGRGQENQAPAPDSGQRRPAEILQGIRKGFSDAYASFDRLFRALGISLAEGRSPV